MNLTLKDLVKSPNLARFTRFRKGELIYVVLLDGIQEVFEFPVPVSDAGDGVFNAVEKAMTLMKYIRKALENTKEDVDG